MNTHGLSPLTPEKRILLVDDDPDVREAIRDALDTEGYATAEAKDGREAIEWLRRHRSPPLILLDWNMGGMNGPEFMAEAAKDPRLARIPVVLLTADMRAPEKVRAAPFKGYLVKPVDLDALFALLARHLDGDGT